jgi:hypothetical protein
MPQFSFGSGFLYGIPSGANPTPVLFGTLQEVTLDISFTTKKLYGQNQFPVAIGRGPASATASAKAASISANLFNTLFAGLTSATGSDLVVNNESGTPASSTITVTNATGFSTDLGVVEQSTGVPLKRVASAPTAGQYSVNTGSGAYTFNASDTTAKYLSYSYNSGSTGFSAVLTNQAMGAAPVFSVWLSVPYGAGATVLTYKFYQCVSTKLSLGFKNEDFTIPQFDMEFFADAAGNVYKQNSST